MFDSDSAESNTGPTTQTFSFICTSANSAVKPHRVPYGFCISALSTMSLTSAGHKNWFYSGLYPRGRYIRCRLFCEAQATSTSSSLLTQSELHTHPNKLTMLFKVLAFVLAGVHLAVSTPAVVEGSLVERGVVERDVAVTHSGDGTSIASISPGL